MLFEFFDLQLFADAEGTSGAAPSEGAGGQAAADTGLTAPAMQSNASDTAAQGADAGTGADAAGERLPWEQVRELYKDEIDADAKAYAKQYSKDVVSRRLAKQKADVDTLESLKPFLEQEMYRRGLNPGDYAALVKAVEADKSVFRERAMANGTTEEVEERFYNAIRDKHNAEAEIARRDAALEEERQLNEMRTEYLKIAEDVKLIREQFDPSFDLKTVMATNQRFAHYANEPHNTILDAYKLAFHDDIIAKATAKAAEDAVTKAANAVRSGTMPQENAVNAGSPAIVKVDPSKLSKKEIDDYIAQAAMGANITFR